ncbi:hypothetical protein VTG60DRAFT_2935 [Thermothelomyces hinnuleus]
MSPLPHHGSIRVEIPSTVRRRQACDVPGFDASPSTTYDAQQTPFRRRHDARSDSDSALRPVKHPTPVNCKANTRTLVAIPSAGVSHRAWRVLDLSYKRSVSCEPTESSDPRDARHTEGNRSTPATRTTNDCMRRIGGHSEHQSPWRRGNDKERPEPRASKTNATSPLGSR